jgi:hypothetical protein
VVCPNSRATVAYRIRSSPSAGLPPIRARSTQTLGWFGRISSRPVRPGLVGFVCLFLGCSGPAPAHSIATSGGAAATGGNGNTSGGGSGDGGVIEPYGPLGLACSDNLACPDGLICLGASGHTLGEWVPAGGYCTQTCTRDSDCASYAGAACVELVPGDSSTQYCAPPCTLGDDKACGNRADVACWPLQVVASASLGRVCLPLCNNDDECPSGTVCDGTTNLCSMNAQGGGQSLGTACDASGVDTCADGICLDLGQPSGGVCSAYCRRGTFPQCGGGAGICAWVLQGDEAAGPADTGLCALRCRCDAECNNAALHCEPHADLEGTTYPGICSSQSGAPDTDCTR